MSNKIVSIHQPNLFPWLGYFYKIYSSDTFIILDDVQIQKTGSNYTNRTSILNLNGSSIFLTIPVQRITGTQLIKDVQIIDDTWRKKFIGSIQANYSRTEFYKKNRDLIFDLISSNTKSLCKLNENIIFELCNQLKIDSRNLIKSSLYSLTSSSTDRLIDLVKAVNGKIYLSGSGGIKYQDEKLFSENNIDINYIKYPLFNYPQVGSLKTVNGLSIIDAIFNIDFAGIEELFEEATEIK